MTEQIQCICKPKCKCAANPNVVWVKNMQSRRIELAKKREQERESESKKRDKKLIDTVLRHVESAISNQEAEIELINWSIFPDILRTLREEYFIGLDQVGGTPRYKFTFLV